MTRKSTTKRPNRKKRVKQDQGQDELGLVHNMLAHRSIRSIQYTSTAPGRATVRGSVELFNGSQAFAMGFSEFNNWCGPARGILSPFAFFRVAEASVRVLTSGGSSSAISVAYNISNTFRYDNDMVSVLNDNYAALATGAMSTVITPPSSFWKDRSMNWFSAVDPISGSPTDAERVAGVVSVFTSGAPVTTPATVAGWAIIDMVLEFHTLL